MTTPSYDYFGMPGTAAPVGPPNPFAVPNSAGTPMSNSAGTPMPPTLPAAALPPTAIAQGAPPVSSAPAPIAPAAGSVPGTAATAYTPAPIPGAVVGLAFAPAPRGRRLKIALISGAVVVVVVLAGLASVPLVRRFLSPGHRIVLGTTVAGMTRIDNAATPASKQQSVGAFGRIPGHDRSAGVYVDPATGKVAMSIDGMSLTSGDPATTARKFLWAISPSTNSSMPASPVKSIDPGPLGGTVLCSSAFVLTSEEMLCSFADHDVAGTIVFLGKSAAQAAAAVQPIRADIEKPI
jgi:hypothetical protein